MAITFGTGVEYNTGLTNETKSARIDDNHFVVVYRDNANGYYAKVGTLSPDCYNTNDDGYQSVRGLNQFAQSFTASSSYSITGVRLKIYRTGTPGTGTVTIRAADGSDFPTGSVLASGTINGDGLSTSASFVSIPLTSYSIVSGNKYVITVSCPGATGVNYIEWRVDNGGTGYSGGKASSSGNGGDTWSDITSDFLFETYSSSNTIIKYGSANYMVSTNSGLRAITMLDSTHVAVAYSVASTNYAALIIGTIAGETITFGSSYTYVNDNASATSIRALSSTSLAVAYKHNIDLNLKMVIATISGNTVTGMGTHYIYCNNNGGGGYLSLLSSTKLSISYADSSSDGRCIIANVSGSSISFGTSYVFYDATSLCNVYSAVELDSTHFVFVYYTNASYSPVSARVGTVSGDTISYGSGSEFEYGGSGVRGMSMITSSSFALVFSDSSDSKCYATTGSVANGDEVTVATSQEYNSSTESNYLSICTLNVTTLILTASPYAGIARVGNVPAPTSIKSINRLIKASVKSVQRLVIVSVKAVNGLQ